LQVSGAALQSQIVDGLAQKQETLTSASNIVVASLTSVGDINTGTGGVNTGAISAESVNVQSATGNTALTVADTAGTGNAMLRMDSAGCAFQFVANSTAATIRTNTAHRIQFQANRFGGNSVINAIDIKTDNRVTFGAEVTFADGSTNASDARIKSVPEDASTQDSLNLLKAVSARTYERLDKPNTGTRLGFIAQEVQAAVPPEFAKLVGSTMYAPTEDGEETEILTVDYARMSCVLWTCCRSLLQRVEALEAAAP
jgi:hypothetical protein